MNFEIDKDRKQNPYQKYAQSYFNDNRSQTGTVNTTANFPQVQEVPKDASNYYVNSNYYKYDSIFYQQFW